MIFTDLNEFLAWFAHLNPQENVDMHEAYTVFFNQETYLEETT